MADRFYDGMPGAEIRRELNSMWETWLQALEEAVGPQGWSPAFGVTSDGARRVLQIVDWVGGAGEKPTITGYVGASGIVPDVASAVDIRGAQGVQGIKGDQGDKGDKGDQGDIGPKGDTGPANSLSIGTVQDGPTADATITGTAPSQTLNLTLPKGDQGPKGDKGDQGDVGPKGDKGDKGDTGEKGDPGDDGWTPVMAAASDGERRVIEILDWTGGAGTKPATGYLGATGVVSDIAQAIDVRGAPGAGAVSSVNSIGPDGSGDVSLGITDIPGLEDALDDKVDKSGLATVATTGSYDDLTDKPTLGTAATKNAPASGNAEAGEVVLGSDTRLTNSREWTASIVSQAEAEAGTSTTARKWTAQRVWQAITAWWNASAAKDKLDSIQAGATANQTDAYLLDRANHTGTQPASSITGLTKDSVGLSNVDNTSDMDKPISTAVANALSEKADASHTHTIGNISGLQTALEDKLDKVGGTIGAGTKEAVTSGSAISITDASAPFQQITLTGNVTATVNLSVGTSRSIWINPGTYTIVWPSGTQWKDGGAPGLTSGKWALITFTGSPNNAAGFGALIWSEE